MSGQPEDILERQGEWEIRVTIYRNGRRVGTCDTTGHETYASAAYWAGEGLNRPEVDLHIPKRHRPAPSGEAAEPTPEAVTDRERGA